MIVVMDYGVALTAEEEKMPDDYPRTVLSSHNIDKIMVHELIPYIERKYKATEKKQLQGFQEEAIRQCLSVPVIRRYFQPSEFSVLLFMKERRFSLSENFP